MRATTIPPNYAAFRAVALTRTVLVLLPFGMGVRGLGPLHSLSPVTSNLVSWLHDNTRVSVR
jgi:hypothetical protein